MNNDYHIIENYFPNLTDSQKKKFQQLKSIYFEWNEKINVISRKDMDNFYERHVLHSLAIAKIIQFQSNAQIMDIGTGGGFPGIPLAIMFPESQFLLVDSIGKKIKVVNEVIHELGLKNVKAQHARAEEIKLKFDFIVSRAVTQMPKFLEWTKNKFNSKNFNDLPNGILYLKGGDLTEEMSLVKKECAYYPIEDFFKEDFFETKKVVYLKA